jgi:hypothetical protein
MAFGANPFTIPRTTYLVNGGVCSFTWSPLSAPSCNPRESPIPSFSSCQPIQHRWRYEKAAITTYLYVVHLCYKLSSAEVISQEKVGVGEEGDNGEGSGLYMGSGRATKLGCSHGTAGSYQLSSTVRSCRPCCEPEIADNAKFWPELVPVPSQRSVVFIIANSYGFSLLKSSGVSRVHASADVYEWCKKIQKTKGQTTKKPA